MHNCSGVGECRHDGGANAGKPVRVCPQGYSGRDCSFGLLVLGNEGVEFVSRVFVSLDACLVGSKGDMNRQQSLSLIFL